MEHPPKVKRCKDCGGQPYLTTNTGGMRKVYGRSAFKYKPHPVSPQHPFLYYMVCRKCKKKGGRCTSIRDAVASWNVYN